MIPRLRPPFGLADLAGAWRTARPGATAAFEQAFAARFGFEHGLFFPMGRGALYALLTALEWTGREVVMPAYTCVAVPHAVVVSGNRPRFVDAPADHFNVRPDDLERALGSGTAMVLPTPVFGYPLDDAACLEACRRRAPGALVVFDLAHGFGCQTGGPGLLQADGAIFGLGIGKLMSTLNGGMLLLRDAGLAAAVRRVRAARFRPAGPAVPLARLAYGAATWTAFRNPLLGLVDQLERRTGLLRPFTEHFYGKGGPELVPEAFLLPAELQAALGLAQLARYDALVEARRATAHAYEEHLGRRGIPIYPAAPGATYSQFPLLVPDRSAAVAGLLGRGIQPGVLIDYACPDLPGYEPYHGTCPNASRLAARMINLPNWPGLTPRQAGQVAAATAEVWHG